MKKIEEILNNYDEYKTFLDDRFGIRFAQFLTIEQLKQIGFEIKDEYIETHNDNIEEWNRDNILRQLEQDVKFGWEKACDERGISSNLMFDVVRSWNKVLEEGLENWNENNYEDYGKPLFIATSQKYGFKLESEEE